MEFRVLKYFLMVSREENITKAAQLLHVTQPTLSRQLMQLEEELGVKLLRRSSHSITLTEDGMLLKRRAQELVALANKTRLEFSQKEAELTGEIAIGGGELQSVDSFSGILTALQKKHPLIRYNLYSGNADNIKDRIELGLLDIGLLLEPVDIRKYDFIRLPQKETWGVLVRKDSVLAAKKAVTPEDLVDTPLMISRSELLQNEFANWFGDYYDRLHFVANYNLLYNAAIMVRNKMGVALCLKLDSIYEDLSFVPLSPPIEGSSVLVWKKDQVFSATTTAFLDCSKKYIKGISCDV